MATQTFACPQLLPGSRRALLTRMPLTSTLPGRTTGRDHLCASSFAHTRTCPPSCRVCRDVQVDCVWWFHSYPSLQASRTQPRASCRCSLSPTTRTSGICTARGPPTAGPPWRRGVRRLPRRAGAGTETATARSAARDGARQMDGAHDTQQLRCAVRPRAHPGRLVCGSQPVVARRSCGAQSLTGSVETL